MKVAIIPARGGSKRIPRKNIKQFWGKPIIAYAIEAAKNSGCFDRIIVSTDDSEIASIALRYGAEVPFVRPDSLSDDYSTTLDVIKHSIEYLNNADESKVEFACCIYATAPFVTGEDLEKAFNKLISAKSEYVFSATSYPFPIQRAIRIKADGFVEMLEPDNFLLRSQDLEEVFHDAGQFYWGRADAFLNEKPFFFGLSMPYLLPRYRVQDIDTPEDWIRAEGMYKVVFNES